MSVRQPHPAGAAAAVADDAAAITLPSRADLPLGPAGPAPPPDDAVRLVRRAQAGDRAAFEQLVRGTARMLYARMYLEAGDRDAAEDLVQETYLTAWRSIGQLTDVADASAFRRWLFAVARTARIDAGRRDRRKKRAGPRAAGASAAHDDLLAGLADPGPTPAEALAARERREQVLGLLRALPEEYRAPVAMRYLAGADYATIADQLGLTNGSLRGLLNRGMARLRQMLGAAGE